MAAHDGSKHGGEDRKSGAVVEETFALEDRLQPAWGTNLAKQVDDRDRIGSRHDGTKQDAARPVETKTEMSQNADHHHSQEHTERRQQADRDDPAPHLVEVERERSLEDQPRHKRQEDEVRTQNWKPDAGNQADEDAADGQEHRVRDRRGRARDEAQHGGGATHDDQKQEEALGRAHRTPNTLRAASTKMRATQPV